MTKSLKEKEIRWYPTRKEAKSSYLDKPHLMSEYVKEAVLKFEDLMQKCIDVAKELTKELSEEGQENQKEIIEAYEEILKYHKYVMGDWNK